MCAYVFALGGSNLDYNIIQPILLLGVGKTKAFINDFTFFSELCKSASNTLYKGVGTYAGCGQGDINYSSHSI